MSETTTTPTYIQTLKSIPKQSFLFGPSPVQFLPRLSKELSPNGDVKIWAKRDDCNRYADTCLLLHYTIAKEFAVASPTAATKSAN
jgi:hypothetical protein